ncbi:MAG: undecaprenyldiphospho-muramoylpentapeptide beta-N-acetylglucosaminyltransferase [Thermoleophilia bacterium]
MSRILIAGGGTAGHVVPALAIADVLTERGYSVHFCGGPRGMERDLVTRAGYPFSAVRIRGFERRWGFTTLRTLASLPVAAVDAWRVLRRVRPACVVGVGAYASGPVVAEAAVLGVPSIALEMDAHIGVTNRILSRLVDRVCLSFPIPGLEGERFVYTGRPVRPSLLAATREAGLRRFGLDPEVPVVLVFGGSLGARTLNTAVVEAFGRGRNPFAVLHVTGRQDYERVRELVGVSPDLRYQIHEYLEDFELALAAADVAVSRAGGSVAELLARGVPSVLVPFPLATADHQTKNAMGLQESGAALMIPDAELDGVRLAREVQRMLEPETRAAMSAAARALSRPDAADRIADEIVHLAGPPRAEKP